MNRQVNVSKSIERMLAIMLSGFSIMVNFFFNKVDNSIGKTVPGWVEHPVEFLKGY